MVATLYIYSAMLLQQANGSTWDLRTMWGSMSALPRTVVVVLFILSIYSFGVMIDRALMYSAARKQSRVFVQQVAGALKEGKLDEAIAIAERNKKSHIAKVVATGLSEFQSASQQVTRTLGRRRRYRGSSRHHRSGSSGCRPCRVGLQLLHQQSRSFRRRNGQLLDGVDQLFHLASRREEIR